MELKKAGAASADVAAAHAQLRTYLHELPMAFRFATVAVASDGITAKYGTPFTPLNHFSPWNVDDNGEPVTLGQGVDDATSAPRSSSSSTVSSTRRGSFSCNATSRHTTRAPRDWRCGSRSRTSTSR